MKTIGLIGGTSWYSTAGYYKTINELVNKRLGSSHSAKILLYSVDFQDYHALQEADRWSDVELLFSGIAIKLEQAGADCMLLCANTPHIIADQLIKKIGIPFIHIADETAKEIKKDGKRKVLLLGTKFTMENTFFTDQLKKQGIETMVPEAEERIIIHDAIVNEFTKGIFTKEIKNRYQRIISDSIGKGAEGVIFGCTEIALLLKPEECDLPVYDTAFIHASAAVDFAVGTL